MPYAKTRHGRLRQVHHWLQRNYPTPFPTMLRVEVLSNKRKCAGENYYLNGRIVIRIHKHLVRWIALDTLFHEYAHVMTRRHENIERLRRQTGGHDAEWGMAYAKLYSDFVDHDGYVDSFDERE